MASTAGAVTKGAIFVAAMCAAVLLAHSSPAQQQQRESYCGGHCYPPCAQRCNATAAKTPAVDCDAVKASVYGQCSDGCTRTCSPFSCGSCSRACTDAANSYYSTCQQANQKASQQAAAIGQCMGPCMSGCVSNCMSGY